MDKKETLLFASSNAHKVEEIQQLLPSRFKLLGLHDIQWTAEIPEPFETFEENAQAKATTVFNGSDIPCFADDSGLIVDALDGRPGVYSARYAGENRDSLDNINKILEELGTTSNRSARFVAVIAFQKNEEDLYFFRGEVEGSISFQSTGSGGFGYDPVFIPAGFDRSFGELSPIVKNSISHRAAAMRKFIEFLSNCEW